MCWRPSIESAVAKGEKGEWQDSQFGIGGSTGTSTLDVVADVVNLFKEEKSTQTGTLLTQKIKAGADLFTVLVWSIYTHMRRQLRRVPCLSLCRRGL